MQSPDPVKICSAPQSVNTTAPVRILIQITSSGNYNYIQLECRSCYQSPGMSTLKDNRAKEALMANSRLQTTRSGKK